MSDEGEKVLTLSDVEEIVNEFAQQYAKRTHDLPPNAVRIILWPTDKWIYAVESGPTAIIRMGILPGHPKFNPAIRRAIDHVRYAHAYQCLTLESTLDIARRENELSRTQRVRYGFKRELVPDLLEDEDLSVSRMTRVEVIHRESGLREVVEVEQGKGNIFTMLEVAKARLSRRVHEEKLRAASVEAEDPFTLPPDDPSWMARTA